MREYVDSIQGDGAWDAMHDAIGRMEIFGWSMPPIEVDGMKVHIFPGEDREVTVEAVRAEIRRVLAGGESLRYVETYEGVPASEVRH